MKKNKLNLVRWLGKSMQRNLDKSVERRTKLYKASPIGYPLTHLFIMLYIVSLILSAIWVISIISKPIPFEVEGSCNSGFIGVDYSMDFRNEPYKRELWSGLSIAKNFTNYKVGPYPRHFNLKNIDGLNCNFKAKGAIPLIALQELS